MLSVDIIERMFVNAIVVGARLNEPTDALLSTLLARRSSDSGRATEAVAIEYQLVSQQQVLATGLVVMVERTVEPLRLELTLDADRRHLTGGRLCFGDAGNLVASGSQEHGQLRDRLLAAPDADFAWKERFRRADDGWHHDAG
jgi:hypothetical protein